ncbi:MAG: EAL domain-containing protein [Treponema sp.]|jgi:EAL domain-containing protein (putative c-di-GMP-specific phosphodiesterase class I)|nr:EAL domain-containing protein [Treponema sp.]
MNNEIDVTKIIPFFQPIIAADTREIYSFEVLGRFIDDDGAVRSLGPLFESKETTNTEALQADRLVRKSALQKYAEEIRNEYLFINIRLEWLVQYSNRLEELPTLQWAREFGIDPQKLVIEITEEEFNSDNDDYLKVLRYYRDSGCRIAIDDYGKNANDISRIDLLSPDIVKIDMDYIHKSQSSHYFREYLSTMAGYAERVGIEVLYEGIENEKQLDICMSSKGRFYQGFLIAKPQAELKNPIVDLSVFNVVADRGLSAVRAAAGNRNRLRLLWEDCIDTYLKKHPFECGDFTQMDFDEYLIKLYETMFSTSHFETIQDILNKNVKRMYLCAQSGIQISRNIEITAQGINFVDYRNKNWAWRGYFRKTLFAFDFGRKSYLTEIYRDATTKEPVFTFGYLVSAQILLFIDICA